MEQKFCQSCGMPLPWKPLRWQVSKTCIVISIHVVLLLGK